MSKAILVDRLREEALSQYGSTRELLEEAADVIQSYRERDDMLRQLAEQIAPAETTVIDPATGHATRVQAKPEFKINSAFVGRARHR